MKPSKERPNFSMTDRDYRILYFLALFGGLRAMELSTLEFWKDPTHWQPKPHKNCQQRLLFLHKGGYVTHLEQASIPSEGRRPFIHLITQKGIKALAAHRGVEVNELRWRKVDLRSGTQFLDHLMSINEVIVATMFATKHLNVPSELVTWIDDLQLRKDHSKDIIQWEGKTGTVEEGTIIPDSYIVIHREVPNPKDRAKHFFLEADLGTETIVASKDERRSWDRKIRAYASYYQPKGRYEQRYKTTTGRVLTVTTSQRRLANLKRISEEAGAGAKYWFSTFELLTPLSVLTQPIWQQAGKEGLFSIF